MCGFVGIISRLSSPEERERQVERMTATLVHRGPDDVGLATSKQATFGFRRLSIIDLSSSGHQPMKSTDGRYIMVFNGEIYNYRQLRNELEGFGVKFRGKSDSEVLLSMFARFGAACFNRLRGMFAVAIWDSQLHELFLARDRFGKKPIHYSVISDGLVFGSEIKALLAHPDIGRQIDYDALDEFFCHGFISAPHSIYARVRKVRPGHYLRYSRGQIEEIPYWSLSIAGGNRSYPDLREATDELRAELRESVRIRLESDVPLGAFLSGGVDSTLVVALMAELSHQRVKTFTVGFKSDEFDERIHARMVANQFDTDHTELIADSPLSDVLIPVLENFDEPFGDPSSLPTYLVSRMTRSSVTVALSGDGGDEIFGGYDLYADALNWNKRGVGLRLISPAIRMAGRLWPTTLKGGRFLREYSAQDFRQRFKSKSMVFDPVDRPTIYSFETNATIQYQIAESIKERLFGALNSDVPPLRQLQIVDVHHYLADDILVKVDRTSMLNSLEVRSPLLDHVVAEYAFSLPEDYLVRHGERKFILKQILAEYFPQEFVQRRKQGFAVPLAQWFRNELGFRFEEVVLDGSVARSGILSQDRLRWMLGEHRAGRRNFANPLWLLLAFGVWFNSTRTE
jgi:asparagine synthase (glutamine-hydrolysing)